MLRSYVLAAALFSMVGCVLPAGRAAAAIRVLSYNVETPTYGIIGSYTNTISETRHTADVRTTLRVAVKILGIRLFHEEATREEWWRRHRLMAFRGLTDADGRTISVTGQAEQGEFVIHSTSDGTVIAPAQVYPSNPWSPFLLKNGTMMSTRTGRLTKVVVRDTGEVTATFDGRAMRVQQWFVDGAKHQIVWIDRRGVIVAFQTPQNGHTVTFVLKNRQAGESGTIAGLP